MKKLRQFLYFDTEAFFKHKDLAIIGSEKWVYYETGEIPGTIYKILILNDKTVYGDERSNVNDGETFKVKVPHVEKQYQKLQKVKLINSTANVYGDYMNNLSVKADDIQFLE